jgi:hypothetical protein
VEAGSHTSAVATKREPSAWECNWATPFLEDINMGAWASSWGNLESEIVKYGYESRGTRTQESLR